MCILSPSGSGGVHGSACRPSSCASLFRRLAGQTQLQIHLEPFSFPGIWIEIEIKQCQRVGRRRGNWSRRRVIAVLTSSSLSMFARRQGTQDRSSLFSSSSCCSLRKKNRFYNRLIKTTAQTDKCCQCFIYKIKKVTISWQ